MKSTLVVPAVLFCIGIACSSPHLAPVQASHASQVGNCANYLGIFQLCLTGLQHASILQATTPTKQNPCSHSRLPSPDHHLWQTQEQLQHSRIVRRPKTCDWIPANAGMKTIGAAALYKGQRTQTSVLPHSLEHNRTRCSTWRLEDCLLDWTRS